MDSDINGQLCCVRKISVNHHTVNGLPAVQPVLETWCGRFFTLPSSPFYTLVFDWRTDPDFGCQQCADRISFATVERDRLLEWGARPKL